MEYKTKQTRRKETGLAQIIRSRLKDSRVKFDLVARWVLTVSFLLTVMAISTNVMSNVGDVTGILSEVVRAAPIAYEGNGSKEKGVSGWAVSFDNDILVPASRDQDYTYGSSLTVSGLETTEYLFSLNSPLSWINRQIGVINEDDTPTTHSVEFGLYGFTPEDKSSASPLADDRPYASIIYLSNTQELPTKSENVVWRSTLTVGILGLDIVGDVQNEVHEFVGSDLANGWAHQISDGGEITARYSIAKQRRWDVSNPNIELKTTSQASVGYITELSWGANVRIGRIHSRWQSYNPELVSYGERTNQSIEKGYISESYFLFGAAIKARAHNAFLQGQFSDNEVEYGYADLNHAIFELWAGYTQSFRGGYQVSYLLRGHSSEVKNGNGDRNVLWGGLTLSKKY